MKRNPRFRASALASFLLPLVAGLALPGLSFGAERLSGGALADRIEGGPELLMIPQRSVPMFSATVLVPAGSSLETPATNGAAHYLEHLLFNGTQTRSREEIYALADRLGAYNNASTQRERTVFQLLLPSENWRAGLELQADMILNSTLPADMFEKEKGIILEELAKNRSDATYAFEQFVNGVLWGGDARSLPVLGSEGSIANMDRDELAEFYRERYRPEGMTIVVMGDFDPDEVRGALVELYGGDAHKALALPSRPGFPEGRQLHSKRLPDLEKTHVRVLLPLPAFSSPRLTIGRLLANVLASGERSAISRSVETAITSGVDIDSGEPYSVLTVSAELPSSEDPAQAVQAIFEHLAETATSGCTTSEVETARRQFMVNEIFLREKMHYYGLMQADVLDRGGPGAPERLLQEAERAKPSELRELLGATLAAGRFTALVAGPDVEEGVKELPAVARKPGKAPEEAGGEQAPWIPIASPRSPATSDGFVSEVTDEGLTLVLRTSPEGRSFAAHLLLKDRAGWERALGVPAGTADVLHRMLELGTARSSRDELRGRLSRAGITLKVTDLDWIPYDDYYFSPEYSYVRLECVDNAGLEAIAILREILATPRLDEDAFTIAKEASVARARKDQGSPSITARRLYYSAFGDDHPLARGPLGDPEALGTLTLEQLRRFAAAYLDARNATLVVSANGEPSELLEALRFEPLFAAQEADRALVPRRPDPVGREIEGRRELSEEVGREQCYLIVGSPVTVVPEDEAALQVAVAVLSERLADRLREREGLAYSIGAAARLDAPGANVRMQAGTRRDNLERLETGMREVATGLVTDVPGEDELAGARNRSEGRRRMRRLSRIGEAYAMVMAEFRGDDPEHLDRDLPALRAVTPDDVRRVAERYLSFEPSIAAIAR